MEETRSFKFIVRDLSGKQVSQYMLDDLGSASKLPRAISRDGFGKFSIDTKVAEGDVVDRVIKQSVKRDLVSINLAFVGARPLDSMEQFRAWVASYMNARKYRVTLEITTGAYGSSVGRTRMFDLAFRSFEPKERHGGVAKAVLTVLPLSLPYTEEVMNTVLSIQTAALKYPYTYPYSYGGGDYNGTGTIVNNFKDPIPLIVVFHGHISSPEASLVDEAGNAYSTIRFTGLDLAAGASLKVDAVNGRIVFISSAGVETDYYNEIDKDADTFLFAKNGTSTLTPNLDQTDPTKPSVDVTIVRYGL